MNILVTAGRSITALNVLKALNHSNHRLFTADITRGVPYDFVDQHFVVPKGIDTGYIDRMLIICLENNIDFVFPISDFELRALSENQRLFEAIGCQVLVPNEYVLDICLDKRATSKFFSSIGIYTPLLVDGLVGKRLPLMMRKRYAGRSAKCTHKIEDIKDLLYWQRKSDDELIFTEFIDGREWTIDVVCSPTGDVLEIVPRERLQTVGGLSTVGRVDLNQQIIDEVKQIVSHLGITDICCIQCKRQNGINYYFEINARPGGGMELTIEAGVNMPRMVMENRLYTTHKPFTKKPKNNLLMTRHWEGRFCQL